LSEEQVRIWSTTSEYLWRGRKMVKTNSLRITTKSRRWWHCRRSEVG
jgi:hypothetical protein